VAATAGALLPTFLVAFLPPFLEILLEAPDFLVTLLATFLAPAGLALAITKFKTFAYSSIAWTKSHSQCTAFSFNQLSPATSLSELQAIDYYRGLAFIEQDPVCEQGNNNLRIVIC
jgi:hypothetical protein